LIARRDFDAAEREIDHLEKAKVAGVAVLTTRAALEIGRQRPDEARRALETAIVTAPENIDALTLLTKLDVDRGRAQQRFDTPSAARGADACGNGRDRRGRTARAYGGPGATGVHRWLPAAGATLRKYWSYRRSVAGVGTGRSTTAKVGQCADDDRVVARGAAQTAEAEKQYEKVLEINPAAGVAANNLGWLIAERGGNLDVALRHGQAAVAAMPESADAHDTLGWIYHKKGMCEQSIRSLGTVVEKDSKNPVFHYHLGLAYVKAGNRIQARKALEDALRLQPNFPDAANARAALTGL
jgi:tetratricopeptide (TPR) repeat protein